MNEKRCENCKYLKRLKHNCRVGSGFEESSCCIVFANEKNGFALQVELNDVCEMYQKGGERDG